MGLIRDPGQLNRLGGAPLYHHQAKLTRYNLNSFPFKPADHKLFSNPDETVWDLFYTLSIYLNIKFDYGYSTVVAFETKTVSLYNIQLNITLI